MRLLPLAASACVIAHARGNGDGFVASCAPVELDQVPYRLGYSLGLWNGVAAIQWSAWVPTQSNWGAVGLRNAGGWKMANLDITGFDSEFYSVHECTPSAASAGAPVGCSSAGGLTRISRAERVGDYYAFDIYRHLNNGVDYAIADGATVDVARAVGVGQFGYTGHGSDITNRRVQPVTFTFCANLRAQLGGGVPQPTGPAGTLSPSGPSCTAVPHCAAYSSTSCQCTACQAGYGLQGTQCLAGGTQESSAGGGDGDDDDDGVPVYVYIIGAACLVLICCICAVLAMQGRGGGGAPPAAEVPGAERELDAPLVEEDPPQRMTSVRAGMLAQDPPPTPGMPMPSEAGDRERGVPYMPESATPMAAPAKEPAPLPPQMAESVTSSRLGLYPRPPPLSSVPSQAPPPAAYPSRTPTTGGPSGVQQMPARSPSRTPPPHPASRPPLSPHSRVLPPHLSPQHRSPAGRREPEGSPEPPTGSPTYSTGSVVPSHFSADNPGLHEHYEDIVFALSGSPRGSPTGPYGAPPPPRHSHGTAPYPR